MQSLLDLLVLLFLTTLSLAAPHQYGDGSKRAVYSLSNNANGSQIVALSIAEDGTVSNPILTSTGGKGLQGLNVGPPFGAPGSPAMPDSLFTQGSVHVADNYIFTVNAGSHTVSMFAIDPEAPLHPKLVGKPADTLGEFPQSVAYSKRLQTACVVNGGAKNGVACFSVSAHHGLRNLGPLRPLSHLKTQTPPLGPPNTATEIRFNPSSSAVFVTTKGTPPSTSGNIYVFPVHDGHISTTPIINTLPKIIMDFSIDFLGSDASALITDPTFGASIVSISPSFQITEAHHIVIPNQKAACWGAYSPRHQAAYVVDAGHTNITVVDPVSGDKKGVISYESDAKGGFDTVIQRDWMYTLSGDSSILVFNLEGYGGKMVQHFSLKGVGPVGLWEGLAAWPVGEGRS